MRPPIDPEIVATLIRDTARTLVLPRFRALAHGDIREKAPGDLVTVADVETERELTRRLTALLPGSLVLGEEGAAADPALFRQLDGDRPVWIIDPVDGTSNFAKGQPGFAVIVALAERAVVRAGWIYDPLADVLAHAVLGAGAWSGAKRLHVAAAAPGAMIGAAYGRSASGLRSAKALAESGRIGAIRNRGCSGLEYLAVALGAAHFALHSRSLPWDHAAGMLITAEAGGVAGFLDGSAYDPRILDRAVLAAASREGWDLVRDTVAPAS